MDHDTFIFYDLNIILSLIEQHINLFKCLCLHWKNVALRVIYLEYIILEEHATRTFFRHVMSYLFPGLIH